MGCKCKTQCRYLKFVYTSATHQKSAFGPSDPNCALVHRRSGHHSSHERLPATHIHAEAEATRRAEFHRIFMTGQRYEATNLWSCGPGYGGSLGETEPWAVARSGAPCQLPNSCPQARPPPWPGRTALANIASSASVIRGNSSRTPSGSSRPSQPLPRSPVQGRVVARRSGMTDEPADATTCPPTSGTGACRQRD
jgi:hypothetical protein